jgi:hypothetical protein
MLTAEEQDFIRRMLNDTPVPSTTCLFICFDETSAGLATIKRSSAVGASKYMFSLKHVSEIDATKVKYLKSAICNSVEYNDVEKIYFPSELSRVIEDLIPDGVSSEIMQPALTSKAFEGMLRRDSLIEKGVLIECANKLQLQKLIYRNPKDATVAGTAYYQGLSILDVPFPGSQNQ